MKGFLLSLRSEFYKSRNTLGFWCSVLLPLIITGLVFTGFYNKGEKMAMLPPQVLWLEFAGVMLAIMGALLLPIYIIFVTYSVNSIEHKADTWKTLFSLPISKWAIYASKYFYALFLVALCLTLFGLFTLGGGYLLSALKPALKFSSYNFAPMLSKLYVKLFLASLGIFSIQFLMSLLWKDFLKPMGIGFACTIIGVIMVNTQWAYAYLFPYAHPIMALSAERGARKSMTPPSFDYFTHEIVAGLIIALIFFIAGFFIVQKRSVK